VARSRESSFGLGNQAGGNWLSRFLEPGARHDVALATFFRKVNELTALGRPVLPHIVGIEAAGFDRADVANRMAPLSGASRASRASH
jgi:hypothetical protein